MDTLVSDFVVEAADSLGGLQADLAALSLDRGQGGASADMLRRMHAFKGLCGFVGFVRAEAVSHAAESLLHAIETSGRPPSWRVLSLLADALERLADLIGRAAPELAEPEGEDDSLITELELAAIAVHGDAVLAQSDAAAPPLPAAVPGGAERRARPPWVGLDVLVRGLGDRLGKRIDLMIGGDDVRPAVPAIAPLRTALIALVRNACDHGIETHEQRRASGKPGRARLQLTVRRTPEGFAIDLTDDGRGLDLDRIRQRAVEAGVITAETAAEMTSEAAATLAFAPGVSTAEQLTAISGRGLGLELVRREVEALGGQVETASTPGVGTRFTLLLPASALAQSASRRLAAA